MGICALFDTLLDEFVEDAMLDTFVENGCASLFIVEDGGVPLLMSCEQ